MVTRFTPEDIRAAVAESQQKLGNLKINVLYLHAPDRAFAGEDIHRTLNELYKEGALCVESPDICTIALTHMRPSAKNWV